MSVYLLSHKTLPELCYVGSTLTALSTRLARHKSGVATKKHNLAKCMAQEGVGNFKIECLESVTDLTDLRNREQHYIDTLKPKLNMRAAVQDLELRKVKLAENYIRWIRKARAQNPNFNHENYLRYKKAKPTKDAL
jgi:group I intron endonuclease